MFILAFDEKHRILRSTIVGVLSSELLAAWDLAIVAFTARRGHSHALIDLTQVAAVAVPLSRMASFGRQPQVSPGWERVILAPRPDLAEWARTYSEYQSAAGNRAPLVVATLEEAYESLELTDPVFEPA